MDFVFDVLQFAIAWFIGSFLSMPITQIGICLFCAFPLLQKLKPYSNCIDVSRCKRFYQMAVVIQLVILGLAICAVLAFAPEMMCYGFFCSLVFTTITGMGRWGCNATNVGEFIQTVQKFVVPGKEDEAFFALTQVMPIR